jgi:hypothetical protein
MAHQLARVLAAFECVVADAEDAANLDTVNGKSEALTKASHSLRRIDAQAGDLPGVDLRAMSASSAAVDGNGLNQQEAAGGFASPVASRRPGLMLARCF